MSYFPNQINALQPTHTSPGQGSAAYTSSTSITVSNFPFTVDDTVCLVLYILYKPTGGAWQAPLMNGIGGVSIVAASGVLTVTGATTPFASGDTYAVGVLQLEPTIDTATDSKKVFEIAGVNTWIANEDLVDTTNITAATHYYPSESGGVMNTWKDGSLSGKFIDADGTLTLTLEVTNDEDTAGDWIQAYFYDDKNNITTNSITVTNGTLTFLASLNNNNFRRYRWVVTASGATNTVILKHRKKAL